MLKTLYSPLLLCRLLSCLMVFCLSLSFAGFTMKLQTSCKKNCFCSLSVTSQHKKSVWSTNYCFSVLLSLFLNKQQKVWVGKEMFGGLSRSDFHPVLTLPGLVKQLLTLLSCLLLPANLIGVEKYMTYLQVSFGFPNLGYGVQGPQFNTEVLQVIFFSLFFLSFFVFLFFCLEWVCILNASRNRLSC